MSDDRPRRPPTDADTLERLLAENDALARRIERLAPVLASMAFDLATTRRENVMLKRENTRLHARAMLSGERSTSRAAAPFPLLDDALAIPGAGIFP